VFVIVWELCLLLHGGCVCNCVGVVLVIVWGYVWNCVGVVFVIVWGFVCNCVGVVFVIGWRLCLLLCGGCVCNCF